MSATREIESWLVDTVHSAVRAERGGSRDRTKDIRVYSSGVGDLLEVREGAKPAGCQRKLYLDFFPEYVTPRALDDHVLLNFAVGDAYHATVERLLASKGVLVVSERSLKTHQQDMSGRLDWLVRHPEHGLVVVDGKSMSPWAFDNKAKPQPGDLGQVMSYFAPVIAWCHEHGVTVTEKDFKYGALLYFNKVNGKLEPSCFEYSQEVADAIDSTAAAFTEKVRADRANGVFEPPPMPAGCEKGNQHPCQFGREKIRCTKFHYCHPEIVKADAAKRGFSLGA